MSNKTKNNIIKTKPISATQFDLQERKRQAYHLKLRGYSPKQISIALGVSIGTVYSYLKERQETLTETLKELNPDAFAADVLEDFAQLRKEAWLGLQDAKTPAQKRAYLSLIASLREKEIKTLQTIGIFDEDKQSQAKTTTLNVQVNGPFQVNLSESKLEALSAMLCSAQMDIPPEMAIAMRGRQPTYIDTPKNTLRILNGKTIEQEPVQSKFQLDDEHESKQIK